MTSCGNATGSAWPTRWRTLGLENAKHLGHRVTRRKLPVPLLLKCQLFAGFGEPMLRLLAGNNDQAVIISQHKVMGPDRHPAASAATSRTAPFAMSPARPLRRATPHKCSPTTAVWRLAPASITTTSPALACSITWMAAPMRQRTSPSALKQAIYW